MPRFKACPEDFVVDEIPLYPPTGEGPHTFLRIEKRLRTTEAVAEDLARAFSVKARDIGYAGRKDRVAITRQWFSVPDLDPEVASDCELPGAVVLEAVRHQNKLRTGHLRGNRFDIRVRDVGDAERDRALARLDAIKLDGFPNRYGAQRFGRSGDNAARALSILKRGKAPRDRRRARFLISALQAEIFNRVLAGRPLSNHEFEVGDLAMKHESGGVFCVENVAIENERAKQFEISPTGPIFGTKVAQPLGAPAEREAAVLAEYGVPEQAALASLRGISLRGARRALRARPGEFEYAVQADTVRLEFTLSSGSYATVLLEEAFCSLGEELLEGPDVNCA